MKALKTILHLTEKDLRIELRTKEIFISMALFVLLTLVIFNFSLGVNTSNIISVAPGIMWVVIAFSGLVALTHLAHRERQERVQQGVILSGCGGIVLFLSKFLTTLIILLIVEMLAVPLFLFLFNFSFGDWLLLFMSLLVLGSIGYAAIGTLFANLLSDTKMSSLLLPVVFYPVIIPLFIIGVQATSKCLEGTIPIMEITAMLGFDLIFLTACALCYEFALEDHS